MEKPVLSVDLAAIQANFEIVRSLVGPHVAVAAVVKSDAYGLGLDRVARALGEAGCKDFFVTDITEADRVRAQVCQADIYVLAGIRSRDSTFYQRDHFIPVCNTPAEVFTATSLEIPYALNLETGFGRLGLRFDEVRSLAHSGLAPPVLLMSHLACADDGSSHRNRLQRDRFVGMSELLSRAIPRSLAASAGISLGPDYFFDQVRVGSALYGLNNANLNPNPFMPVLRLSALLADVRQIHNGETVGYMGTFVADRPTRLGIVGLGYRHGLPWHAANRLAVEFAGYLAPVVGRISMEYCAIDLTEIPAGLARVGARVDFISQTSPAESVARSAATVAQELLVRSGASCKRRYCQGTGQRP